MKDKNNNKGLFIVLLGPDGAGKSTVSSAIKEFGLANFTEYTNFHWRPGLLPKPGNCKRKDRNSTVIDNSPPPSGSRTYGRLISLLRFLYYLTDFIFGYWLLIYTARQRGSLIVGERWYYDVVLNPTRYGFWLPCWILKYGNYLVPSPDLVILLSGDPAIINKRKPELTEHEIKDQLSAMEEFIKPLSNSVIIKTDESVESTIQSVHDLMTESAGGIK